MLSLNGQLNCIYTENIKKPSRVSMHRLQKGVGSWSELQKWIWLIYITKVMLSVDAEHEVKDVIEKIKFYLNYNTK